MQNSDLPKLKPNCVLAFNMRSSNGNPTLTLESEIGIPLLHDFFFIFGCRGNQLVTGKLGFEASFKSFNRPVNNIICVGQPHITKVALTCLAVDTEL